MMNHSTMFAVSLAASLLCSCTSTYEGVLEIATTAIETVSRSGGVTLHPRGDRVAVDPDVSGAFLEADGCKPLMLAPGAVVELSVTENEPPTGARSRLIVDGDEVRSVDGRMDVRLRWVKTETRVLPPKVESVPIELERGGRAEIDVTVMYAPMPDSKLTEVRTEVRLEGPDADDLKWIESAPPDQGRVRGRVEAPAAGD